MFYIPTHDGGEIMSPKNDFAFRLLFNDPQRKDILINLLNTIVAERIQSIDLLDTHVLCSSTEREGILDVRALTDAGTQINIEMQVHNIPAMERRTLYYWAMMYSGQLLPGQQYNELSNTIAINILDYIVMPIDDIHTCFHAYDRVHNLQLSNAFEIHFFELPKLHRHGPPYENTELITWLMFLNGQTEEELCMAAEANPAIKKAYDTLKVISLDENNRRLYEARVMFLSDEASLIYGAREEGREEGIEIGREKGREEERESFAKKLLSLGMDDEFIMKATGLDKNILDTLKFTLLSPEE